MPRFNYIQHIEESWQEQRVAIEMTTAEPRLEILQSGERACTQNQRYADEEDAASPSFFVLLLNADMQRHV